MAKLSLAKPERHLYGAAERQIDAESETLGKLRLVKSGLVVDLLTGRVRVPEQGEPCEPV